MNEHLMISSESILHEVINRILDIINPQRIILFGSTARREEDSDSDLDLLLIVSPPVHRRQIEQQIYSNLRGIKTPVDIIVATDDDIEKYGDRIGLIYRPALREGRVVYEAWRRRFISSSLVGSCKK